MSRFKVQPTSLYLGDNGRALCGDHLGYTAKTTGRDLSGQSLLRITPAIARDPDAAWVKCESCGRRPAT